MKTQVKSFSQLKKLVEEIKTSDGVKPISVETEDGSITIPSSDKSIVHKLLIEGFDSLADQSVMMDIQADVDVGNEDYGGFTPAVVLKEEPQNFRLDRFIDLHFDGKREGMKITWDLPEGRFELDPWTLILSKS